jgi:hypothetical protein
MSDKIKKFIILVYKNIFKISIIFVSFGFLFVYYQSIDSHRYIVHWSSNDRRVDIFDAKIGYLYQNFDRGEWERYDPTGKEPPSHMGGSAPIAKFTDDLDKPKQVQFIDDLGDTKPEDKKQSKPTQGGAFDDLPETSQSKP